ncbi:hypothetical protein BofuT4_uP055730.1 [Botrytis cinerea T4]|uniref:Uncharacterized protein n=1 Tax=Botryotinia fuckeliana (strain T4) TaxID=999810 RepID=G2XW02_BOTF4|nr:hypothetical protein BofuT4_uP055730.1 [Botrytis cinerea T4]
MRLERLYAMISLLCETCYFRSCSGCEKFKTPLLYTAQDELLEYFCRLGASSAKGI